MTARRTARRLALLAAALLGMGAVAAADPITVNARFVRPDGSPLAGLDVRMVIGSEPGSRRPDAGNRLATNGDGHIAYVVDAPVAGRTVGLDSIFFRHPARTIEVGVEMELVGRRALYRITLDLVRDGTIGAMAAFVQGPDGAFDRQLTFHADQHAFSFPDEPGGMMMTSIGADLKFHEMRGEDGGPWVVDLVIEKQEFTIR